MSQSLEAMWTEAVLTAAAGTTEQDTFVNVTVDEECRAVVSLRPIPDTQGQLVLTLSLAQTLAEEDLPRYREALLSTAGLRRNQAVEYAICLLPETQETVLARFSASLLTPSFMRAVLEEMRSIMGQALVVATTRDDEFDTTDTETDMVLHGGLRV